VLLDHDLFFASDLYEFLMMLAREAYERAAASISSREPDVTQLGEWMRHTDRARTLEWWMRMPSRHAAATARLLAKRLKVPAMPSPLLNYHDEPTPRHRA
jgi:hypothetical protein